MLSGYRIKYTMHPRSVLSRFFYTIRNVLRNTQFLSKLPMDMFPHNI